MPDWLSLLLIVGIVALLAGWARWRRHTAPPRDKPDRLSRRPAGARPPRQLKKPSSTAPPQRRSQPQRSATTAWPEPGEIWWADVPYEGGAGSKVRPCLVLRVGRDGAADVLKITSQDKSHRTDHVRIPTKNWDPGAAHNSFLDLTDPIRVIGSAFENRAGNCDPKLWDQVRRLHHLPESR
ncbi:MAG TPA: type II toxin-antitoxin system PemK/MazF family toxin [Micromonosporaceae bacterium]|nr:type II toxin-antitoxin system PemK/MazF family toxin [Micromonosporaceae bacterium]